MRISYDLNDTLICYQKEVPRETAKIPLLSLWLDEPLRKGTRSLIADLKQKGCNVWICTSSSRSPFFIRLWLAIHGVWLSGRIITQETYAAYLKRFPDNDPPSKNPRAFGIQLHIDDEEGVKLEGEQYGFAVLVIAPDDAEWTQRVSEEVARRLKR